MRWLFVSYQLPPVGELSSTDEGSHIISFSHPYDREALLGHTQAYLAGVFGEPFFCTGEGTSNQYYDEPCNRYVRLENKKDRVDRNGPYPVYHDGAGFILYTNSVLDQCRFSFSYCRAEPDERADEWCRAHPLDLGYETYFPDGFNLIDTERYVCSLPGGKEAVQRFYQSIIDNPSGWRRGVRGFAWRIDVLKEKLAAAVGMHDERFDGIARIGASGAVELEWWLMQEATRACAAGRSGAAYERHKYHDEAVRRAAEYSGDGRAPLLIDAFLAAARQAGFARRMVG